MGQAVRTVSVVDTVAPVLTLKGEAAVTVIRGKNYSDAGCTASDNYDGDLSAQITVSGEVDTSKVGTYTITYQVADSSGNQASALTRTVTVKAPSVSRPVASL